MGEMVSRECLFSEEKGSSLANDNVGIYFPLHLCRMKQGDDLARWEYSLANRKSLSFLAKMQRSDLSLMVENVVYTYG